MSKVKNLSDGELIEKYKTDKSFYHISNIPLNKKFNEMRYNQNPVGRFNVTGRPDGIWFARGSIWLTTMAGWNMNVCCYLYQINLRKSARVLTINYTGDMKALSKYRKYWVNYDYFGFNWYDCVAQSTIVYPQKRFYNYNSLIKRNVDTLWDILVNNKIIFTNVEDARANCELYRGLLIPIERLYLIDWGSVVRDWDVILFDRYSLKDGSLMEHLWVQTLSAASGCIINTIAIESVDYVANKIDYNKWMLK